MANNKTEYIDTETVCITFKNQILPKNLIMWRCIFDMKPFVSKVRLCLNCFKIGHIKKFCRNNPKCEICGNDKHEEAQCQSRTPKCVNCHGDHRSTDPGCRVLNEQQRINKIMAYDNVSYEEAKKRCVVSNAARPAYNEETVDLTDLRNFPALRSIAEKEQDKMRLVFGDSEGRSTPNINRQTSRPINYTDIAGPSSRRCPERTPTQRSLENEDLTKMINEIKATERENTECDVEKLLTVINELIQRIVVDKDKGLFLARLFKVAENHDKLRAK